MSRGGLWRAISAVERIGCEGARISCEESRALLSWAAAKRGGLALSKLSESRLGSSIQNTTRIREY